MTDRPPLDPTPRKPYSARLNGDARVTHAGLSQDDEEKRPSDDFDARLSDLRARSPKRAEAPSTGRSQASEGYKIVAEFVSGVLVGLGLGWGCDRLFGTAPWGLLGFLMLGVAAGFYNVVRAGLAMTRADDRKTEET